mmetsp:Transcript_102881/g.300166  ORF Transcript_102881/g.300166 Transcript_102881/m.300166 type:complete len:255 (+) Transcript_102881:835-1599(+)
MSCRSASASSFLTRRYANFFCRVLSSCKAFALRCSSERDRSSASLASPLTISSASTSARRARAMASAKVSSFSPSMASWRCSKLARLSRSCLAAYSRRASPSNASAAPMAWRSWPSVAWRSVSTDLRRLCEQGEAAASSSEGSTDFLRSSSNDLLRSSPTDSLRSASRDLRSDSSLSRSSSMPCARISAVRRSSLSCRISRESRRFSCISPLLWRRCSMSSSLCLAASEASSFSSAHLRCSPVFSSLRHETSWI